MNCGQIKDILLTDFLDGRLSLESTKTVDEHLSGCLACRALLMSAQQVDAQIKSVPVIEQAPFHVWARIANKIAQPVFCWQDFLGWGGRSRFVYGSVMAGLIVILFVANPILSQRRMATADSDADIVMQLVYADEDSFFIEADLSGIDLGSIDYL